MESRKMVPKNLFTGQQWRNSYINIQNKQAAYAAQYQKNKQHNQNNGRKT